jgi:hypothetical protein
MKANLRKLYDLYKSYISRRRAPLFHDDDRQLATLRLEQTVADYRSFRARNS